jgi:hypothetical protein
MRGLVNLCPAIFLEPNLKSCLVKHLPKLLAQSCIPKHVSHNLNELPNESKKFWGSGFEL